MDKEFQDDFETLAGSFLKDVPSRLHRIRNAYDQLDPADWPTAGPTDLYALLHTLAGTAGTFGQKSLSEAAKALADQLIDVTADGPPRTPAWHAVGMSINRLEQIALARLPPAKARRSGPAPSRTDPLVYVVDDDRDFSRAVAAALQHHGYRTEQFRDPARFAEACRRGAQPDVVLMDLAFPLGRTKGAEVLASLRQEIQRPMPAICVSVQDDLQARLAAFRAGASRYLLKPVDFERLTRLVDELCSRSGDTPYRVLVADDDYFALRAYVVALEAAGLEVESVNNPLELLDRVRAFSPDVLLLDVYMPEASGPELAAVLREDETLAWMPILFLSAETDPSRHALALAHGGDDFLIKPVRPAYLQAAVRARAWRARRNRRLWSRGTGSA